MAADQRRKRLNGASIAGCSFREQYRMKKKKMVSHENDLNTKSHISLEWDGSQKRVVAKKEQIAISRRDLRPFIDSVPHSHSIVADVLAIPQEVFELENLTEVLSYEVWQTHLSENEKKFLVQFLPIGQEAEQVVQALLDGDNFHFGNPFLKWGASLCSGNLHPDAVLCQEQGLKADKKAHYSELQKYHNDIIEYLQNLKERWESCKDPEKEVVQKIWRPRREMEKRISSHANESRVRDVEQDVTATSESCSWVADEKACSSDNQYSSVMKGGGIQKRMGEKGFMKEKGKNPMTASDDVLNMGARPKNGDKLRRSNLNHSDGAKYMSYFKISKTQHQLVKSMKQSGKSIQSRSLNRVLGNLDSLHVQPYEVFVKEEQKKLQEHWLQLANEHLPAAYANWRARQLQRREMTKSLEQDMKDKINLVEDEEKENPENMLQDQKYEEKENPENVLRDQKYNGETNFESSMEDEEESIPGSPQNRSPQQISSLNDGHEFNTMDVESGNNHVSSKSDDASSDVSEPSGNLNTADVTVSQGATHSSGGDVWPAVSMPHSYYDSTASHEYISASGMSLTQPQGNEEQCSHLIDLESELHEKDTVKDIIHRQSENNHVTLKSDDASSDVSESSGNLITADVAVSQGAPHSSGGDVWSAVGMPHSYYDSTASHKYTSASGLSLTHPQHNEEQRCRLIDLESDLHEDDTGKDIIHRRSDDGSFNSYPNQDRNGSFNSYPNQDRNELLQSLFKDQGVLSYHHEQKRPALDFQPPNNVLMEDGQFPGHFQEPSLALDPGQKSQSDVYMQQNILENIYPDGGRYLIPRQEHLPPGNVQDWTINPVRMSSSLQPHLNSGELSSQNWFSREHQVRGGWSGSDGVSIPTQSMGSGNNAADQSLFGVLSQCSQLRSGSPFDSMGSTEQIVSSRNYGMMGGGIHGISNTLPQVSHPLDYLGGRDAATSLMPDDVGWVNLQHQNSALHDPMGKPYLRSWNQ